MQTMLKRVQAPAVRSANMRRQLKANRRYTELEKDGLFILTMNKKQFWMVHEFAKELNSTYTEARTTVTRLRDAGVPILNRGSASGMWYIPKAGQAKLVREDIAHRRRTSKGWDNRTDKIEKSAWLRLIALGDQI